MAIMPPKTVFFHTLGEAAQAFLQSDLLPPGSTRVRFKPGSALLVMMLKSDISLTEITYSYTFHSSGNLLITAATDAESLRNFIWLSPL